MSPLLWTCKSVRRLADELTIRGHDVSHQSVASLLRRMDYNLQANRKNKEGVGRPGPRRAVPAHRPASAETTGRRAGRRFPWTPRRRNWSGISRIPGGNGGPKVAPKRCASMMSSSGNWAGPRPTASTWGLIPTFIQDLPPGLRKLNKKEPVRCGLRVGSPRHNPRELNHGSQGRDYLGAIALFRCSSEEPGQDLERFGRGGVVGPADVAGLPGQGVGGVESGAGQARVQAGLAVYRQPPRRAGGGDASADEPAVASAFEVAPQEARSPVRCW